ncbi:TPA: hypothetical protein I7730_14525 [Vibrio vulnificus]|uniref:Uncharacterized protein n=1 Tax=Vibrio vulnificus TaxID=672 RepID=A0A8H9N1C6_VIBVL|nr:hypothetical protein [Vibrio vulnificus]HAS8541003.1 hypothetical protein [Vibrio vulnificus]
MISATLISYEIPNEPINRTVEINTTPLDMVGIQQTPHENKEPLVSIEIESIDIENNRLLAQRALKSLIKSKKVRRPFNYSESDYCDFKYKKKGKLKAITCSNHVFKRSLTMNIENEEFEKIPLLNNLSEEEFTLRYKHDEGV